MPKARSGNPARVAMIRARQATRLPPWTPFQRHNNLMTGEQVWQNSRYMVMVAVRNDRSVKWVGLEGTHDAHLSFRRRDREPDIPWRDLQRIKSELAGSEAEAVEVFPAESRMVDSSNQRHLWVWRPGNPNAPRLGWYSGRQVADEGEIADKLGDVGTVTVTVHGGQKGNLSKARQNPFEDGIDANLDRDGVIWDAMRNDAQRLL